MRHGSVRLISGAVMLIGSVQPVAGQTTNGVPPTDAPTRAPPPKIDPRQVADFIKGLITPKPRVTPTAPPSQPPAPIPVSTAVPRTDPPKVIPRPAITPVQKPAPQVIPSLAVLPRPVPTAAPPPAAPPVSPGVATLVPELASPPPEAGIPLPLVPQSAPFPWVLLAGLVAVAAAAGYGLRRWFWPKLALDCRIDSAAPKLIAAAHPLLSAPDLLLAVEIEIGAPSTPRITAAN